MNPSSQLKKTTSASSCVVILRSANVRDPCFSQIQAWLSLNLKYHQQEVQASSRTCSIARHYNVERRPQKKCTFHMRTRSKHENIHRISRLFSLRKSTPDSKLSTSVDILSRTAACGWVFCFLVWVSGNDPKCSNNFWNLQDSFLFVDRCGGVALACIRRRGGSPCLWHRATPAIKAQRHATICTAHEARRRTFYCL